MRNVVEFLVDKRSWFLVYSEAGRRNKRKEQTLGISPRSARLEKNPREKSTRDTNIVRTLKHIDIVFPASIVPEIDALAERLNVLTRGEMMRKAWRVMKWLVMHTTDGSTIIIFEGPPPPEQFPGETTRVSAMAIL